MAAWLSLVSFLCLFPLCALYLLRVLCVEALLCKSLQCPQSFSSSFAFETFSKKVLQDTPIEVCMTFLFLDSLSLAATSGNLNYLAHCTVQHIIFLLGGTA